ncbi:MAG: hypothetical protein LBI41_01295 [Lactobacillales bacterium]|jgi:hypothetical protein|nr:hypothetical protein [Lactobacillales bacterium]
MKFKNIILAGVSIAALGFAFVSECSADTFNAYNYGKSVYQMHEQELNKLNQETRNNKCLQTILENLKKISRGELEAPNPEVEKISSLWQQFKNFSPEQLISWREEYINSNFQRLNANNVKGIMEFFIEYSTLFSNDRIFSITKDDPNSKKFQIIVHPSLSRNLPEMRCKDTEIQYAKQIIYSSFFNDKDVPEGLTENINKQGKNIFRERLNKVITAFASPVSKETLKNNLKQVFELNVHAYGMEKKQGELTNCDNLKKFRIFVNHLGEDSKSLYNLSDLPPGVMEIFNQAVQDVKDSYIDLFDKSDNFSAESKLKIKDKILNVSVNDYQSDPPQGNYLQTLSLTENFQKNVTNLLKNQHWKFNNINGKQCVIAIPI